MSLIYSAAGFVEFFFKEDMCDKKQKEESKWHRMLCVTNMLWCFTIPQSHYSTYLGRSMVAKK